MTSGETDVSDTDRPEVAEAPKPSFELGTGPGRVLVWFYGVFTVAAASRTIVEMARGFDRAPLAYTLSALAALVYGFITYSLVRGGEKARRAALVCCAAELIGVLVVGAWTLVEPPPSRTRRCGRTSGWATSSSR